MSSADSLVSAAGLVAAQEAERLWRLDIIDPRREDHSELAERSRALIAQFIHEGLGWTEPVLYEGDGDFSWCGAFAAFCWRAAGARLSVRKQHFASTRRLDKWASEASTADPAPRRRLVLGAGVTEAELAAFSPQPGDLLLVGAPDSPHGSHIALLASFDPVASAFSTFEGNGFGCGPGSDRPREGLVRVVRHLGPDNRLLRVLRLGLLDLTDSVQYGVP